MIINSVTLRTNLIAIEMGDFDVVMRIDFLEKHNAIIDCRHRMVTFRSKDARSLLSKEDHYSITR